MQLLILHCLFNTSQNLVYLRGHLNPFTPGFMKKTSLFQFRHIHCWKQGCQSKINSHTNLVKRQRFFFYANLTQKIQTCLINKVFGHISIFGKVWWHHMITENTDHQCRKKISMTFTLKTSYVPLIEIHLSRLFKITKGN